MDQSASVGGNVILFDGTSISWEVIAPDLGDVAFAVADSGVSRSLGASSYPRRVEESNEALRIANSVLRTDYAALADLSEADLEQLEVRAEVDVPGRLKKRIRHVVTETARVRDGVEAMRSGDWVRFGELMTASGRSSALDYEISHPRVEQIVEIAHQVPGVLGARMMGGGEGGAALLLVKQSGVPSLVQTLDNSYYREFPVADPDPVKVFRFAPGSSVSVSEADSAHPLSEAQ
jgi:galactokinase